MRRHDRMRNSQSKETRMSAASEEVPANSNNNIDPMDALSALARRAGERAEPRLATVTEKPVPRMPRIQQGIQPGLEQGIGQPVGQRLEQRLDQRLEALRQAPVQGDRLESAMNEFVRRQLRPEAVPEPAGLKRDAQRQMMFAGAVMVAVAAVVALVFVTLFPRPRDIIQSFAAAVPQAPAQSTEIATAPSPQSRSLLAESGSGEALTHEQSEQLLQQFAQWRQNLALPAKP
jgi:hypothetical protein